MRIFSRSINIPSLATDGDGVLNRTVTSDPGHLLLSGVLNKKQQTDVVERLFEPDLMTDYGIRCLSLNDANFDSRAYQRGSIWPHDNWIIARGLRENGFKNFSVPFLPHSEQDMHNPALL